MILTADFETTTDENDCRVWLWGVCEVGNPQYFVYGTTIDDFIEYCNGVENHTIYFHNLKFDGTFLLSWLFENGFTHVEEKKFLKSKTFTTLISDKGQFYTISIMFHKNKDHHKTQKVTFYDSLKILPFSVADIADGFGLPVAKGSIDYDKPRPVGYAPTYDEIDYLHTDLTIPALALHTVFSWNLTQMTQGSNALFDFKNRIGRKEFDRFFPSPEYDADIRQSYKGGFTYLKKQYADVDLGKVMVFDVNSLYPSVMRNRPLPYGVGVYFNGEYENDDLYPLYIQMFTCQFELKEKHIPTIQIKHTLRFIETEYLESSGGEDVTLCLTNVDLELFFAHYDVYNIEYHSGWKFKATTGLFNDYIDYWSKVKIDSKRDKNKAMYTLAKLMLNALYGKFATNPNVQSKYPYYENGIVKFKLGPKETRSPIYLPVGTFVTSWARYTTITAAQSVYDRFVYADTDSLHITGDEMPSCIEIDAFKLGAWKHENTFDYARFLRQKSYIEGREGEALHVTCAGLPDRCHELVTWENFHPGVTYGGKLTQKTVVGGIVLKATEFSIKDS